MSGHQHEFAFYLALVDRWACACGISVDRERGLWHADGTRAHYTVQCTAERSSRQEDEDDVQEYMRERRERRRRRGVCSGRELMTC